MTVTLSNGGAGVAEGVEGGHFLGRVGKNLDIVTENSAHNKMTPLKLAGQMWQMHASLGSG